MVTIGDAQPCFPNYTPCLLKRLIEQNGLHTRIHGITGMDTQFSDPEYEVPMSYYGMMTSVPDYHKSTDTPEVISPDVLRVNYKILYTFTERLMNTGFDDVSYLATSVWDYWADHVRKKRDPAAEISAGKATPAFARECLSRCWTRF